MCNQYNTIDYIAVIDLKKRLFDMNESKKGFPENLRFKISKTSDEKIIAHAIETTNYNDGSYITWDITVTVDRYLGYVSNHIKNEPIFFGVASSYNIDSIVSLSVIKNYWN